jgi:hypothetical protein
LIEIGKHDFIIPVVLLSAGMKGKRIDLSDDFYSHHHNETYEHAAKI